MKDEINYIYNRIKGIKEKSPVLLLERAAVLFEENYSGEIYTIEDDETLKEIIDTFSNIEYDKLIAIKGISYIKNINLLNNFIDNIKAPIIFLMLYDTSNISKELLSRIQTVIKIPYTVGESKLISGRDGLTELKEQMRQPDQTDKRLLEERIYATESPELYYLKEKSNRYVCNDKIVDLLSLK